MVFRGQTLGKYRIIEPLGSGGFGTVYLAEDTWIDKKVALKVPHKQGVDFGELLREARLLAALDHPNIVGIVTAERQENVFFIVMETGIRKRGKLRVRRKIESAGISPATAKRALDEVFGSLDDDDLLESALAKRLRRGATIADEREFNRLYRYLVGQGFEPQRVLAILRRNHKGHKGYKGHED